MPDLPTDKLSLPVMAISVLWPSFMMAIVATGIFFSAFDPQYLALLDMDIEHNPLAIYSIGFFTFWILFTVSNIGALYFAVTNCKVPPRKTIEEELT